jgi:Ca2+-binding RTX toxin-like protein
VRAASHRFKAGCAAVAAVCLAVLVLPGGAAAATVGLTGKGQFGPRLVFAAEAGEANRLVVKEDRRGRLILRDRGARIRAGRGCDQLGRHRARCTTIEDTTWARLGDRSDRAYNRGRAFVIFFGGRGDDRLGGHAFGARHWLHGGRGDDRLQGGRGSDFMWGERGRDRIYGGSGDDNLDAGPGRDRIYGQRGGDDLVDGERDRQRAPDRFDGGPGAPDTVGYGSRRRRVDVDLRRGRYAKLGERDRLISISGAKGGRGADILKGDGHVNVLVGGSGADHIRGRGSGDGIWGGPGADVIRGGGGDDNISDSRGPDRIEGRRGDDRIRGGPDDDLIRGGKGDDSLHGTDGEDHLKGGDDNDLLHGNDGDDLIKGGRGDDTLRGHAGADRLEGRDDNDHLRGDSDADSVEGGSGNDFVMSLDDARDRADCAEGLDVIEPDVRDDLSGCEVVTVWERSLYLTATPEFERDDDSGRTTAVFELSCRADDGCSGTISLRNPEDESGYGSSEFNVPGDDRPAPVRVELNDEGTAAVEQGALVEVTLVPGPDMAAEQGGYRVYMQR